MKEINLRIYLPGCVKQEEILSVEQEVSSMSKASFPDDDIIPLHISGAVEGDESSGYTMMVVPPVTS